MNIKEIARQAQVSVATVSRVLNHPELVQPETRAHILEVMARHNYTPNWFARRLNLARTNTIALLVPNIEGGINQKVVAGVESVATKPGSTVLLCRTHDRPEEEDRLLRMVFDRRVDGVICSSSNLTQARLNECGLGSSAFVLIGQGDGEMTACYINFEGIAYKMTQHLLGLGRRRIDLLLDETGHSRNDPIISGYRRALLDADVQQGHIHMAAGGLRGGYLAARRLFATETLPDAIFAGSDDLAFGVMKAARDDGVDIPARLAVVGFDDSLLCDLVTPELTSIEQPSKRLGMVAARLLFDLIEDAQIAETVPQEVVLQPKLKIRRSCGNKKYIHELFD